MKLARTLTLVALLMAGCGNSQDQVSTGGNLPAPSPPATSQTDALDQAMLANPQVATQFLPGTNLDSPNLRELLKSAPSNATVANLESAYEIRFGCLSTSLNITLSTPQVVNDIAFIKSQPGTGFFDLNAKPILNNPLGVTAVNFQPVSYNTTVTLPAGRQTFAVSGGLMMPLGITGSQVKGVVVYFHGTTFDKSAVGSDFTNPETQLVAQVFASQGYIVLVPDYVGQGDDWQDVHPYVLYPQVSAQTAVDMLSAVKPILFQQYGFGNTPQTINPQLKLFSAGYSEGGAYSVWFNQYVRSNPNLLDPTFRITHSVGMEGAYSTSNVTYNYLFGDVAKLPNKFNIQRQSLTNLVKPILSADAFLSYATYTAGSAYNTIFNPDFFAMNATAPVKQGLCNVTINGQPQQLTIAQAFAQPATNIAGQLFFSGLGKSANNATYPSLDTILFSSKNSINSLVSPLLFTPSEQSQLLATLTAADVNLSAVPPQGVTIFSLNQDSVVTPNNYDYLQSAFPSQLSGLSQKVDQTQLQVASPLSTSAKIFWIPPDHLHGIIYELLYALNTFNGF